jgi:hypothetical protein
MASKKKGAAKAKKSTAAKSPYGTKTAFVMGLPREMSAREVVAKGKAQGIKLSEAHVYKIRSTSKSPSAKKGAKGPAAKKAAKAPAKKAAKKGAAKKAPAKKKAAKGKKK